MGLVLYSSTERGEVRMEWNLFESVGLKSEPVPIRKRQLFERKGIIPLKMLAERDGR